MVVKPEFSRMFHEWESVAYVRYLVRLLSNETTDCGMRVDAALALGEIRDSESSSALVNALKSNDRVVRLAALIALAEHTDEVASRALAKLTNHPDEELRFWAKKGIKLLRERSFLHRETVRALGELGDVQAVEPLISVAQDVNERRIVRTAAIWSLGWLGDKRASKPLTKILENKNEVSDVRSAAAIGLGNLVGESSGGSISRRYEKGPIDTLIKALEDPDPIVRRGAAKAFDALATSYHAVPTSRSRPNSELRYVVGVVAIEALKGALKDKDSRVRAWAAIALGRVGIYYDKTAYKPLVSLLEDEHEDSDIRCAVVDALIDFHDRRAIKCFVNVLQNTTAKPDIRRACAGALSYFGGRQAVRALIVLLEDDDQQVRVAALESLGWTGGGMCHKWTLSALVPLLIGDNEILFSKALETLERIADERTVPELLRIKKSDAENSLLRIGIAKAIDHVKAKQSRPDASEVSK